MSDERMVVLVDEWREMMEYRTRNVELAAKVGTLRGQLGVLRTHLMEADQQIGLCEDANVAALAQEIVEKDRRIRDVEKRALALENLDICVDRERMVSIRRDGDELLVSVKWKGHEWAGRVDMEGNPKSEPGKE